MSRQHIWGSQGIGEIQLAFSMAREWEEGEGTATGGQQLEVSDMEPLEPFGFDFEMPVESMTEATHAGGLAVCGRVRGDDVRERSEHRGGGANSRSHHSATCAT